MTDRADQIAREIALRHVPSVGSEYPLSHHSRAIVVANMQDAIASALRSYAAEEVNAKLEAAAAKAHNGLLSAEQVRSLKSHPESRSHARQPDHDEPWGYPEGDSTA